MTNVTCSSSQLLYNFMIEISENAQGLPVFTLLQGEHERFILSELLSDRDMSNWRHLIPAEVPQLEPGLVYLEDCIRKVTIRTARGPVELAGRYVFNARWLQEGFPLSYYAWNTIISFAVSIAEDEYRRNIDMFDESPGPNKLYLMSVMCTPNEISVAMLNPNLKMDTVMTDCRMLAIRSFKRSSVGGP